MTVIRPADPDETAEAWRVTIEEIDGPGRVALSRQSVPVLARERRRRRGRRLASASGPLG